MIKVTFLLTLFISQFTFSQDSNKVFSYYIKNQTDQFKETDFFNNLESKTYQLQKGKSTIFNNYDLRIEAGEDLIIDESGIYVQKNKILNISRTEVRENSKYIVRNGYLHGVIANDSIAVALQDELFYFLMPSKSYIFKTDNPNNQFLDLGNHSYLILNKEENGHFSAFKITINKTIQLAELDLNYEQAQSINNEEFFENSIKTFLLTPNSKDWELILTQFVVYETYALK